MTTSFALDEIRSVIDTLNPVNSGKGYCLEGSPEDEGDLCECVLMNRLSEMVDKLIINLRRRASAHNRHPPTRSQSAHRPRWHDRSPPEPFPVSFVPFDSGRNNRNASTTGTSLAPASAIPGSGSSRSFPVLTHIAKRHQPNGYLSWVSQYHRSPARHRCRRRACLLGQVVRFPQALRPRRRPQ
jgi:hypothetical protein